MQATADDPTAYEKMRAGEPFLMPDGYILARLAEGRRAMDAYNAIPPDDMPARKTALSAALGRADNCVVIQPVYWEYGRHIELGDGVFVNTGCTFLDTGSIRLGDGVAVGPNVQFLAASHPLPAEERFLEENGKRSGIVTWCKGIEIGANCWIGGGAIIVDGVTVGEGTTIAAGAVVTKSLPARVLAGGNPARVIREL